MISKHIFRQYDIRGVVGPDITESTAEMIGKAFGTLVRRSNPLMPMPRVALGRDNRLTSNALAEGVRRGLVSTGVQVLDVGTVPTPGLSFAVHYFGTEGGLQVTGSHNPPEYNGFKMTLGHASIYGETIQGLRRSIENQDFEVGQGAWEGIDLLPTYVRELAAKFTIQRPLKVVVDCGNGTGSVVAVDLLEALGPNVSVVPLFCESDGTFPNHHPDPVVDANLQDLIAAVRREGADLGIAFDGDADRIGAVDEQGNIIRGDILLLLYALDLIERRGPGQPIVFDVKCTQALPDVLAPAGGVPVMAKTGHSLIKKRMKEEGSLLAGELSGHIMFADNYYGYDDALYAACLLLDIVAKSSESLSARVSRFPHYVSTSELRYAISEEAKAGVIQEALAHFSARYEVNDVDGVRILFDGGWGLIRASNTEPVLVGRFEARTPERLAEIRAEVEGWLAEHVGCAPVTH